MCSDFYILILYPATLLNSPSTVFLKIFSVDPFEVILFKETKTFPVLGIKARALYIPGKWLPLSYIQPYFLIYFFSDLKNENAADRLTKMGIDSWLF